MDVEQDNQEPPLCFPQIMIIIIRSTVPAKLRKRCFFVEKNYFFSRRRKTFVGTAKRFT